MKDYCKEMQVVYLLVFCMWEICEIGLWDARVKWISVVKFAGDKWICKGCGCRKEEEDDEFDGCLGYENDKIWIQSWFDQRKTCQSQRWSQDCEQMNWLGWYHCWEMSLLDQKIWDVFSYRLAEIQFLYGSRSSLVNFIQERMSVKVVISIFQEIEQNL